MNDLRNNLMDIGGVIIAVIGVVMAMLVLLFMLMLCTVICPLAPVAIGALMIYLIRKDNSILDVGNGPMRDILTAAAVAVIMFGFGVTAHLMLKKEKRPYTHGVQFEAPVSESR